MLHLTYWYSNKQDIHEATWIRAHVHSLEVHVQAQYICHFAIKEAKRFSFRSEKVDQNHSSFLLSGPMPWWLIEILSFFGLVFLLLVKARKYNLVNVHIAYPLLTYFHLIRKWIRKPIVITEHWSGYHFNFGVKRKLPRIQRIFSNRLPLITVSDSLKTDIEHFSHQTVTASCVIPNAVDSKTFYRNEKIQPNSHLFFMLSHWKWPKKPEVIIRAFAKFIQSEEDARHQLRIGGYGAQLKEMEELVDALQVRDNVVFLGMLSPAAVAVEMNRSGAFLHCSEYETFSVVCAEAICSGTPVVASAVGGIREFINESNGVLLQENTVRDWLSALRNFRSLHFNRTGISRAAAERFDMEKVGLRYANFLKEVCDAGK